MSAVQLHHYSESPKDMASGAIRVRRQRRPKVGDDEVLVRMTKAAVNRIDNYIISGQFPGYVPNCFPPTPGMEGVGIVKAVGANVTTVKVGQKVVPMLAGRVYAGFGAWQSYVKVTEREVLVVPSDMSDDVAAQAIIVPLTVLGLFKSLNLQRGQTLLQNGASSQLGKLVIQYARHLGIATINLVRRNDAALLKELKALGADHIFSTEQPHDELVNLIMDVTGGKGADVAIDSVGGDIMGVLAKTVAFGGQITVFGNAVPSTWPVSHFDLMGRMLSINSFISDAWFAHLPQDRQQAVLTELVQLLYSETLTPTVAKVYPVARVTEALHDCMHNAQQGKILLDMTAPLSHFGALRSALRRLSIKRSPNSA
ncbi:hypothetical protein RI367_005204 [Sorochytrium milnesiophthora]